jgi:hypothetical protein
MFPDKLLFFLFQLKLLTSGCHCEVQKQGFSNGNKHFSIKKLSNLPPIVNESSGMVMGFRKDKNTFWRLNDSGGKPEIHEVDLAGNLQQTLSLPSTQNTDWEEVTKDSTGNLYIADIGNNANVRKQLTIYKVANLSPNTTEKINFHYANQSQFPPKPSAMNFDSESLFWVKDSLYFFSKNRGNQLVSMYAIPAQAGEYAVIPKAQIPLKGMITGAAISPSGKEFVLLTYGKLLFFEVIQGEINFSKPKYCLKFAHKQTEAITHLSEDKLLITNEQGNVFSLGRR